MSEMPTIVPTGAALGADIEAVDLRTIDDTVFKAIEDAWRDNLVYGFAGKSWMMTVSQSSALGSVNLIWRRLDVAAHLTIWRGLKLRYCPIS